MEITSSYTSSTGVTNNTEKATEPTSKTIEASDYSDEPAAFVSGVGEATIRTQAAAEAIKTVGPIDVTQILINLTKEYTDISDIFVRTSPPYISYRRHGRWNNISDDTFKQPVTEWFVQFSDAHADKTHYIGDIRTRASLIKFSGKSLTDERGAVLRLLPTEVRSLEEIGFLEERMGLHPGGDLTVFTNMIYKKSGLILVTGRTGVGKSTTLSAAIEHVNENERKHILTLEAPVEYLYQHKNSVITQIEVPSQEESFYVGVRHALRRSPDIIVIGEINDSDTAFESLRAVETGHLVVATLHTANSIETIKRLISLISADRLGWCLQVLSEGLLGIISQNLHFGAGGKATFLYDMLVVDDHMRSLIKENDTIGVKNAMFDFRAYPGHSRPASFIYETLVQAKVIEKEKAPSTSLKK